MLALSIGWHEGRTSKFLTTVYFAEVTYRHTVERQRARQAEVAETKFMRKEVREFGTTSGSVLSTNVKKFKHKTGSVTHIR